MTIPKICFTNIKTAIKMTVAVRAPDVSSSTSATLGPLSALKRWRVSSIEAKIALAPHGRFSLSYGFAFSSASAEEAEGALSAALATHDPFAEAEERFNLWMEENAPRLTLDDPDLLRVYYYRFFVIKCAVHTPSQLFADPIFPGRAVYESPFGQWFGCPIGLPIPLQLEEMRWMKGTEAARDHIGAWCLGLGHTQTYIQYTPMAIRRFCLERGDLSLMKEAYPACRAFTLRGLSPEGAGELPITKGSWLTGAEYQPSFYQYTTPPWDWRYDNEGIRAGLADAPRRLWRADAAAMHLANLTAVRDMAERLGYRTDAALFGAAAAEAERTLTDRLYSREHRFFLDRDVERDALCDRAAGYAGFLPLLFGLVGDEYAHVLDALSEGRFAAGLTLTTVAKDCPMYWFDSHIVYGGDSSYATPHHYPTAWNGPIWPFAVSLVLSALGRAAGRMPEYRPLFLRLFAEYTELHFLGGERTLPCIVEHYRVGDGMPLSPYTEYFHSKWIDLFLSCFAGIGYEEGEVRFAPLTDVDFVLEGVMLGGKCYRFEQKHADGRLVRTATVMAP